MNKRTRLFLNSADYLSYFINKENKCYLIRPLTIGLGIYYNNTLIATSYKLHELYTYLEMNGIKIDSILSKRIMLRNVNCLIIKDKAFILEFRYQYVSDNMVVKLLNCGFKLNSFRKLLKPLSLQVEYIYILNERFKDSKYKDILDYIHSLDCYYYFDYFPFRRLGLPY